MNHSNIKSTGGRGSIEIQDFVNSLLNRYKIHLGSFSPPIEPNLLAELQNASVLYRHGSDHWVSSIMPMGNGFVINVNRSLSENRKRNAICHEVAHTFFFNTNGKSPLRINKFYPDRREEHLCFWAAREMLVPKLLFEKELSNFEIGELYSYIGIKKIAKLFQVSADIIAWRLTHDLGLLGNDWIILWYFNPKSKKLLPKSLYPKHISNTISTYMKKNIIESLRKNHNFLDNNFSDKNNTEITVGKLIKLKIKANTEKLAKEKLYAISWVSPLSGLKIAEPGNSVDPAKRWRK